MDIPEFLNALVGRKGIYKVPGGPEVKVTILSVELPGELPHRQIGEEAKEAAINETRFTVRFPEGTLIDGHQTGVILGRHISRLDPY